MPSLLRPGFALCFFLSVAHAENETPATTEIPQEALALGQALFQKGQAYYSEGRYSAAWVEFQSAYQIVKLPDLLFNIARCEVKMGKAADAARHFREFLAAKPEDPEAENIRRQIQDLETPKRPVSPPPPPPKRSVVPWAALATGGVGVLLAGAGAGTLGAANAEYRMLQNQCGTSCERAATETGRLQSAVGYSLSALGFAALASAAVILPFEMKKKESAVAWSAVVSPNGIAALARY